MQELVQNASCPQTDEGMAQGLITQLLALQGTDSFIFGKLMGER